MSSSHTEFKPSTEMGLGNYLRPWVALSDSLIMNVEHKGRYICIWDIDKCRLAGYLDSYGVSFDCHGVSVFAVYPDKKRLLYAAPKKITVCRIQIDGEKVSFTLERLVQFFSYEDIISSKIQLTAMDYLPGDDSHILVAAIVDRDPHLFLVHVEKGVVDDLMCMFPVGKLSMVSCESHVKLFLADDESLAIVEINPTAEYVFNTVYFFANKKKCYFTQSLFLPSPLTCLSVRNVPNGHNVIRTICINPMQANFLSEQKAEIEIEAGEANSFLQVFSDGSVLMKGVKTLQRIVDVKTGAVQPISGLPSDAKITQFCMMRDERIVVFEEGERYFVLPKPERIARYENFITDYLGTMAVDGELSFSADVSKIVAEYAYESAFFKRQKKWPANAKFDSAHAMLIVSLGKLIAALENDAHPDNVVLKLLQQSVREGELAKMHDVVSELVKLKPSLALRNMLDEMQSVFALPTIQNRIC